MQQWTLQRPGRSSAVSAAPRKARTRQIGCLSKGSPKVCFLPQKQHSSHKCAIVIQQFRHQKFYNLSLSECEKRERWRNNVERRIHALGKWLQRRHMNYLHHDPATWRLPEPRPTSNRLVGGRNQHHARHPLPGTWPDSYQPSTGNEKMCMSI